MKNFKNDVHVAFERFLTKGQPVNQKPITQMSQEQTQRVDFLGQLFEKLSEQLATDEFFLDVLALTNSDNSSVYMAEDNSDTSFQSAKSQQFSQLFTEARSNRLLLFTNYQMVLVFPSEYFDSGRKTSFYYEDIPDIVLRKKEVAILNTTQLLIFLDFQAQDKIFSENLTFKEAKRFEIIHAAIKRFAKVPLLDVPKQKNNRRRTEKVNQAISVHSINWVLYGLLVILIAAFIFGIVPFFIK